MSQPWTPPPPPISAPANVSNYLIPAILSTLFCCLPAGIVSIIYASKVNGLVAAGDIQGAMNASKSAKTWMFVAIGLGVVLVIIGAIIGIVTGLSQR